MKNIPKVHGLSRLSKGTIRYFSVAFIISNLLLIPSLITNSTIVLVFTSLFVWFLNIKVYSNKGPLWLTNTLDKIVRWAYK